MDRAVLRDLRLMQASAETPLSREQRHAIERLLMMPIRSSLDRAPRKSRQPAAPVLHPLCTDRHPGNGEGRIRDAVKRLQVRRWPVPRPPEKTRWRLRGGVRRP